MANPPPRRLPKSEYHAYIRSARWASVRRRYRASKLPQTCYGCGSDGPIDLHHRTYARLGHERLHDLVPLCRPCHTEVHRLLKANRAGHLWGAAKRVRHRNVRRRGWWSDGFNRGRRPRGRTPAPVGLEG